MAYNIALLQHINGFENFEIILPLVSHPSYVIRWETVKTLATHGYEGIQDIVMSLKDDPNPYIKKAVMDTMKMNGMHHEII